MHHSDSQGPDQNSGRVLALLHLSSPALPVGAFAYSQGLEFALEQGDCQTPEAVEHWIQQGLTQGLGQLDLPIYQRLCEAWQTGDADSLNHWNDTLLAFRETKELYQEDIQVGQAFAQWHLGQDPQRHNQIALLSLPTVAAMHGLAAVIADLDMTSALLGFAWSWCENQVACASKAMPMGQTHGQTLLQRLMPRIIQTCDQARQLRDAEIGQGQMGLALASSFHEHQYSRLFRS